MFMYPYFLLDHNSGYLEVLLDSIFIIEEKEVCTTSTPNLPSAPALAASSAASFIVKPSSGVSAIFSGSPDAVSSSSTSQWCLPPPPLLR